MNRVCTILFFLTFCCCWTVVGQADSTQQQTRPKKTFPEKQSPIFGVDSIPTPSNYSVSKDALEDNVDYNATDSILYDNSNNRVHLYGDATVKYQGLELKAGYIEISLDSNIALAQEVVDSFGRSSGQPTFTDGSQNFSANKMRYNFKSNKGIVYDVATTQSNLFLKGTTTKFVTQEGTKGDSTFTDNVLFNRNAIFSTCDAPHPHYGIRSRKQKVVADKVVVVGLSNLEIGGVPTPIYLPFGFFPLKQFKSTGLIFPQGYEYSPQLGFGLDGIGWYFPISEKIDLRLTSQLYWHGTWGITADSRYKKRYKYSGNLNLNYTSIRSLDQLNRQNSYNIRWSHNQDSKAHPTRSFSANVNIRGNGIQQFNQNRNDAQSVLQNTLSSNISFNQSFPGKPYRLSLAMSHSQILTPEGANTSNRAPNVNISLPTANFQLNRIYPFKKERGGNKEKWYEKISFKYDGQFQNKIITTDSTLFKQETLDNMRFAFKHNASTDMNFNILKYISVSPNVNFNEVWYFQNLYKVLIDTVENTRIVDMPAIYQELQDSIDFGFKNFQPWHQFSTGISMSTNLFGTLQFKRGRLKGIRHTVKPSVSFNFTPDYTKEEGFFGGYFREYDRNRGEGIDTTKYSVFQGGLYGSPSFNSSGKRMALSYSINNIFEAKFRPKRDSIDKKIKIFDNIRMGGSYNFAADSLKFSDVSVNGTTRFLKGITNFTFNARYTPYSANVNNRKVNTFYLRTDGKVLRFLNADFRLSTRLSVRDIKKIFKKEDTPSTRSAGSSRNSGQGEEKQGNSFLKFLEGFNLNHTFALSANKSINLPTTWDIRTHNINVRIREITLTEKWSMTVGNIGYDFKNKRSTYPDIGFVRDLHCWIARFNWQPQRGTYYFTIQVKNAPLDMLKLPYQKNNVDAFGGF